MALPNRSTWPRWARVASSAWVVSPFLVFALLIGTFFAYGAYSRSKPTHYSRGGDSFAVIPDSGSPSPSTSAARKKQAAAANAKSHAKQQAKPTRNSTVVASSGGTSSGQSAGQSSSGAHTTRTTTTDA